MQTRGRAKTQKAVSKRIPGVFEGEGDYTGRSVMILYKEK